MNRARLMRIVAVLLVVVLALIAALVWRGNSDRKVLADGTVLQLSNVRIGPSNTFVHGKFPAKLLGDLVPSNGITVAGYAIKPRTVVVTPSWNDKRDVLAAMLKVSAEYVREQSFINPSFLRKHRFVISGDNEFGFVREFDHFAKFKYELDGVYAHLWATSFPRDSRLLRFRIEERESGDTRDWREVATLVVKNPKIVKPAAWTVQREPRFKLPGDVDVEVGELVVKREPIHPRDIWEYTASLPLRIRQGGGVLTNWGVLGGTMTDATDNSDAVIPSKSVTNGWVASRMFRPLDPTKLWRFKVHVGPGSDFSATNVHSFAVPWPLPQPLNTNVGGHEFRIYFAAPTMFVVTLTQPPQNVRLNFLRITDDQGQKLDSGGAGFGQHLFAQHLKPMLLPATRNIHCSIAVAADHEIEFTLKPRYEAERASFNDL